MALYFVLAGVVGVVAGLYLPLNAQFSDQLGSPLLATTVFFVVGALFAVSAWLAFGQNSSIERLVNADCKLMLLGIISFGIILSATVLIPKVGPGAYFVCIVAGQVLAGLLLSHYGLIVGEQLQITPLKAIAAIMIISGVFIIYQVEQKQKLSADSNATLEVAALGQDCQ